MRRDLLLLSEMRGAIQAIGDLVGEAEAGDIESDPVRRAALLWQFTVLGEAASQLTTEIREAHREISWRSAARLRNRIVHGYWAIDMDVLVATAAQDLPAMLRELERVIAEVESTEG